MMRQGYIRLFASVTVVSAAVASNAQGFGFQCIDITNTKPFSNPWGEQLQGNNVMMAAMGVVGTVTFGGTVSTTDPNPPCFIPSVTAAFPGRFGFGTGSTGSIQSIFDQFMAYSFGYPLPAGDWGYATLTTDSKTLNGQPAGTRTLFGANSFITTFNGASDRYFFAETVNGMTDIQLRVDEIGDAARLSWVLTNTDATNSHTLGLWMGLWMAMYGPNTGDMTSGGGLLSEGPYLYSTNSLNANDKQGYTYVPGVIPPTIETRYIRSENTSGFPPYIDFCFGQTNAYGMRIENGPTTDTEDATGTNSDCTQADEFALGQDYFLLGDPTKSTTNLPDKMFGVPSTDAPDGTGGDVVYEYAPGFVQKYYEQNVPSGGARTIVQYYRSNWGASNYFKPYSVVLDAPQLISTDLTTTTGLATPTGGYTIRAYVDNTRGFSTADKSIELDNVSVTIKLPPGINLASGDTPTKVIPKVLPGGVNMSYVEFHVIPDGIANGLLPYSVTVAPTPGPTKTVSGTIIVSSTPKLTLSQGPNLVGTPWQFSDTSWEAILALTEGTDFQAYAWDPVQNGYTLSTSATRGIANWIVATNNIGIRTLSSNPTLPTDVAGGSNLIQLQSGWNLVANPYPYPIPVAQLIGATNANSQQDFVWSDLVSQGFVNGAIGYYNTATGSYNYLQNGTDLLLPNAGYWIFVGVTQPLTLKYPPVFLEYLPGSSRAAVSPWTQTDNQWRLQLAVRSAKSIDDQNFIGKVPKAADVTKLQIMKPPAMPAKIAGVSLAIAGTVNGKSTRMAQALSTSSARQQYTVTVTTPQAGDVTLTWPNIATIPKTVQVRLVDTATGATRVMNQTSGYTFTATAGATRTFQVQLQAQTPGRATIGNVIASRTSRAVGSPVAISYTLGVAATTSIQIVNSAGTAIFTVTSGRADSAGINSVVWNLRDNANRQVAPGKYQVLILASTPDGQTARRSVPVNVVR